MPAGCAGWAVCSVRPDPGAGACARDAYHLNYVGVCVALSPGVSGVAAARAVAAREITPRWRTRTMRWPRLALRHRRSGYNRCTEDHGARRHQSGLQERGAWQAPLPAAGGPSEGRQCPSLVCEGGRSENERRPLPAVYVTAVSRAAWRDERPRRCASFFARADDVNAERSAQAEQAISAIR